MKRSILSLGCLVLFGVPGVMKAAVLAPVMVTLDMPNQVVTAPTSGLTTLTFTGSVFIESGWQPDASSLDFPFNSSQTNFLSANFDPAFLLFTGGTYTGNLFEVSVPAGTLPDLYAFESLSTNPSVFTVSAFQTFQANGAASINGEITPISDSAAFSVQVNGPASGVPDQGSTLLLMGASMAVIELGRRLVRPVLPRL